jgi:hypothetical protein
MDHRQIGVCGISAKQSNVHKAAATKIVQPMDAHIAPWPSANFLIWVFKRKPRDADYTTTVACSLRGINPPLGEVGDFEARAF